MFPSVSPVFFQVGTVAYQHRLRFRWRGFMYEFLPLIRKARTRCDLCRALHDFARLRLTSQCLPTGNAGGVDTELYQFEKTQEKPTETKNSTPFLK